MSIREVLPQLKDWTAAGHACAVAMLYRVQHSSPRPAGSCMAVCADGRMAGAVSMGCVESDLRENMLAMLDENSGPKLMHYGAADEMMLEVGLTCGGEVDVILLPFSSSSPVWDFLDTHVDNQPCLLITGIEGACAGEMMCITAGGQSCGSFSVDEVNHLVDDSASGFFARKRSGCLQTASCEQVFVQVLTPPVQLAIIGGNPISVALCDLAVRTGIDVTVIDPRKAVAPEDYYPSAKQVIHAWPKEGMKQAGVDSNWYIAVLSHDQKLDVPALQFALEQDCFYVGLLGSRGTQQKRVDELIDIGFSQDSINRIHGPIGYKAMGAVTSPEIAVSILAEMIAVGHETTLS